MVDESINQLTKTGKPECLNCRYSLEGLPGPHNCPECGEPYRADLMVWRFRRVTAMRFTIVDAPLESLLLVLFVLCGPCLFIDLIIFVVSGLAYTNPGPTIILTVGVVFFIFVLYSRWQRFQHEYLAVDDQCIRWAAGTEHVRVPWETIPEGSLRRDGLGLAGKTTSRASVLIPIRLIRLTGVGLSGFLPFVAELQRTYQSLKDASADAATISES